MSSGGVGSKTMSGIKQSQARGSTKKIPGRRAAEEPCNARERPGTVAAARTVALPFAFALFLSCAFAQESPKHPEEDHSLTFGGETDFTSGYVWRGLLVDDGPLMQPSAWISKSGFTFAAWTSHPLSKTSETTHLNASTLTLTYGRDWKKLTIEPSVESYFSRRTQDSNDPNTMEGSLKLSYPAGPLRVFTSHAFDVLAYRGAYFGEAGLGYEGHVTKNTELSISLRSGWASSKFNDIYIGLSKRTFNFIGAEGSVSYYLRPYLYFRPHFEFSNIVDRRLREYLESPTINSFGLAMGVEF